MTFVSAESKNRKAAEVMALRARQCATTVEEVFGRAYEMRFDEPGHTDQETIEHVVDVTPSLIHQAEAILAEWEHLIIQTKQKTISLSRSQGI